MIQPEGSALVACESEFVMDDGEEATGYYEDREDFIRKFTSKTYSGDTLRAETLQEINACAEATGDIRISHDTLYLLTKRTDDRLCAAVKFQRFKYTIVMEHIDRYVIVF